MLVGAVCIGVGAYQAPPQGGRQGGRGPAGPTEETLKATVLQKLGDNLYIVTGATPPRNFPPGGGNTAVFITEKGVVLVDTKNPGWGQVILDKVRTVTDKPIIAIINTHTHRDHTGGNEFFGAGAMVESVVQENTKANMQRMDIFQGEQAKYLPTRTFKDTMSLFSGKDRIDLFYFGRGHTNGDAWVLFRALNVVHAGDQFALREPQLANVADGGSLVEHPTSLRKALAGLPNTNTFITGHSTVMTRRDVEEFAQFSEDFVRYAEAQIKAGKSVDEAAAGWKLPAAYKGKGYQIQEMRVRNNMQIAYDELKASAR
ncbi:MAG: MBL fold metallo-hydrolase [Acidobacteria bacterium]|nr:MBL fold metallo-hydrolase [Acidobacteriota bacterium]